MPSAIQSIGSLGSSIGSFFSPSSAGVPSVPTADNSGINTAVPSAGIPSDGSSGGGMAAPSPDYFTGGTSSDPNVPVNPTSLALPAAVGLGPVAAPGALPAETALSTLPGTTDPATNQPLATSMGDPAAQSAIGQVLQALGLGGKGGVAAGLGGLGNLAENIMRWNTMRTLANPAAMAAGAQKMYQPMSKALKRAIISPVTAAAQETGQINAPGLYSQSVATALAPYQYEMQEKALQDYITALTASGGAYPQGGVGGYGGGSSGNTSADIFGG